MGFVGKAVKGIGKAVGGAVKGLGGLAGKVAPALSFIPGVGTLGGAALGGLGNLLAGKGLGGALRGAAMGAGGGLLKGALGGLGGLGGIASKLGLGGGGGAGTVGGPFGAVFNMANQAAAGQGGGGGLVSDILKFLGKNAGKIAGGVGAGAALLGHNAARKSTQAFNQEISDRVFKNFDQQQALFDANAGLRDRGREAALAGLTGLQQGDIFGNYLANKNTPAADTGLNTYKPKMNLSFNGGGQAGSSGTTAVKAPVRRLPVLKLGKREAI